MVTHLKQDSPHRPERVVVVTGGGRGIGAELTAAFADDGAAVVVADQNDAGEAHVQRLRKRGRHADFVCADVSGEAGAAAIATHCAQRYGRVDALVNNAGHYRQLGGKRPFTELSAQEWDEVFAVNARGVWLVTRALYPMMKAQGFGRIVNMASAVVHLGIPHFLHYVASKGAVVAMTRALAREAGADGITVNAVAPGFIDNDASRQTNDVDYAARAVQRRALARRMDSADVVGTVRFLCSADSAFVTGQTIIVDGGSAFN